MTADELARLHSAGFETGRPWQAREFESLLASPTVFLVAEENGFALGQAVGGEAELLTLVTHPAARRQGIGKACLRGFEDEARARFAAQAFLEVAEDNHPARALYEEAGYRVAGTRPDYYLRSDGHVDALLLCKPLSRRSLR